MKKTIEKIMDDIACNCVGNCRYCDKCLKEVLEDAKEVTSEQLDTMYQCRFYASEQVED